MPERGFLKTGPVEPHSLFGGEIPVGNASRNDVVNFNKFGQGIPSSLPEYNGNINLFNRPKVKRANGKISTVSSVTVGFDTKTFVLPTITDDGRIISPDEATSIFRKTGKFLGKFDTLKEGEDFSQRLQQEQSLLDSKK